MAKECGSDPETARRETEIAAWESFATAALTGLLASGQYYRDDACEEARLIANIMTTHRRNFLEYLTEKG